jgi:serine protease
MKRFISSASLAISLMFSATAPVALLLATSSVNAAAEDSSLYYNFGNQKIPLSVRTDAIAVSMKQTRGTRSKSSLSLLQQDFGTKRGGAKSQAVTRIQPLDNKYALLTATNDTNGSEKLKQQVRTKSYITATLPVLRIPGKSNSLILPNEVIVSFKQDISVAQQQSILAQNNLTSVQPIPFAKGFYAAVPAKAKGLEVLGVSNQLSRVPGIRSSMPNFIEVKSAPELDRLGDTETRQLKIKQDASKSIGTNRDIKTMQWHINSQPMMKAMGFAGSRTDVRAPEVWSRGKKGDGVVVAVIDSLVQWDHPALANTIATVDCAAQKEVACLPGEKHGWDFSSGGQGDNDTRVNDEEIASLRPALEESLKSDTDLQSSQADLIAKLKKKRPEYSEAKIMDLVRQIIRGDVVRSFHGTMCTGMIVGNSNNGFQGIAPNVKILPIRAGVLGGSFAYAPIISSIAYAAIRGADVINMSFGGETPNPALESIIENVRAAFPKVVFVAAAGNETSNDLGYPASYPGMISVGAIGIKGNRASYSNFGRRIDVVAPGGDTAVDGGVLTLSGIGVDGFWKDAPQQPNDTNFASFPDGRGYYITTTGTSFAAPAVAGVIALMKSADPQRKLTAEQYRDILVKTSSLNGLSMSSEESEFFNNQKKQVEAQGKQLNFTGEQFFLGNGLVNAEKAVADVERMQR